VRVVLFSDLHLDAAFTWAPAVAARRGRQALRDTLGNVLALADECGADAVLCGGDLYEHDRFTPDTAAFLREAFASTSRRVILAPGNHDWLGPESVYHQMAWSGNVDVFSEARLCPLELADGLTLWGAAHRAPANTDGFLDGGFRVGRGGVNLALFHGSQRSGLASESSGKQPHAPFDAAQIPEAGLDHAFCGHYHRPVAGAYHTYPGNPDPLTFGEDGTRGAVVATVADDGSVSRQWHTVAETEAHDVAVDTTGCASVHEIRERVRAELAGCGGVARVTLHGDLSPDVDLHPQSDLSVASLGLEGLDALQVRQGELATAYDLDAIAAEETVRGQFVRDVRAAELAEDERRRVLVTGLRALAGRDDLEVA
jgi:DNA repair exonuclease SbcCD nuclease subunit